jgi:hypothetical protein
MAVGTGAQGTSTMTTTVFSRWPGAGRPFTLDLIVEPESTYAARRADHLTSHALADFRRNPLLFRKKELGLVTEEERTAFIVGRAVHCRVLEGLDVFTERFAVGGPVNPKTGRPFGPDTKAFAEWAAVQDRPVISEATAALCEQLSSAIHGHEEALALFAEGRGEGVIRTVISGMPAQARLDWFNPTRGLVDLKTIDNLDWFETESRSFGYAHQMAFYRALIASVCGNLVPVHLIAVEKREPYRVGVWRLSDNVLAAAARDNSAAIERLGICRREDSWPTGYEQIRVLDYVA